MKTVLPFILVLVSLNLFASDVVSARIKASWDAPDGLHTAWGTCFAISDTEILTAYHTIDIGKIEIETDGKFVEATLLRHDEKLDIAILRVKSHSLPILKLKCDIATAHVSLKGEKVSSQSGIFSEFEIKMRVSVGASGAPVVLDGKVAGMIVKGTDIIDLTGECNAAKCVGYGVINEFLNKK